MDRWLVTGTKKETCLYQQCWGRGWSPKQVKQKLGPWEVLQPASKKVTTTCEQGQYQSVWCWVHLSSTSNKHSRDFSPPALALVLAIWNW